MDPASQVRFSTLACFLPSSELAQPQVLLQHLLWTLCQEPWACIWPKWRFWGTQQLCMKTLLEGE